MSFDTKPLQAVLQTYNKAWDTHDMKLLGSLFTEDADWIDRSGIWMRGPGNIANGHAVVHQSIYRNSVAKLTDSDFRQLSPDIAVGITRWHVHGEVDRSGAPQPTRHGVFTMVFVRRDGKWLVTATQSTLTPVEGGGPDNSHAVYQGAAAKASPKIGD